MELTAAGVVLFNPDIKKLRQNICAIINQTDYVIMVDNGSKNRKDIENLIKSFDASERIIIHYGSDNRGIAWALNQIFKIASTHEIKWVLTLDQDSVCPENMIKSYKQYIYRKNKSEKGVRRIGILCPTIEDKNAGVIEGGENRIMPIKRCITSGAFTSLDAWRSIGGFDEKMFIDGVDFDFCDRLLQNGYQVIRLGQIRLIHNLGEMTVHRFLFKTVKVQNHSPIRKYYIVRNRFYLARKEKKRFGILCSFLFVIKFSITILLFEKDKCKKIKAVFKGARDGLCILCQ